MRNLSEEMVTEMFARAERGARFLDARGPAGWAPQIDRETLNMSCPDNCLLGQLYDDVRAEQEESGYEAGRRILSISGKMTILYGFNLLLEDSWGTYGVPRDACWAMLTEAWRMEIEARLPKDALVLEETAPVSADEEELVPV